VIPEQLQEYELIRVCRPNCESHSGCSSQGKRPVTSVEDREKAHGIRKWLLEGGNYGVPAHSRNDLVIFDVDSVGFERVVTRELPKDTFTVRSGGDGFGKHLYYRCREFKTNSDYKDPKGSVRSNNYHAVGPGSNHISGGRYEVMKDQGIRKVPLTDLQTVLDRLDEKDSRENVKSGGGARPSSHTNSEALGFVRRDDKRQELSRILKSQDPSHSERLWFVGFLYSACGLYENEIVDLIMDNSPWGTDRSITEKQVSSVSSDNLRGTHYSNYSTDDASFKEGEGAEGNYPSGKTMPAEELTTSTKKSDGTVARAARREIEVDDDAWKTVSVVFGEIEEDETFGEQANWNRNQYGDVNYKDLGDKDPEELRLVAEVIEELAEELE
jgi:hypothetical protein